MKLSISLPDEDIEFLDEYAKSADRSRSAAVHDAIMALRMAETADDYLAAYDESRDDADLWDATVGDGLTE